MTHRLPAAVAALTLLLPLGSAAAQTLAERANRGLVELVTGSADGSTARIGEDLADLLDDGATRRILPVIGKGSQQNLVDLRALRGIDLAIVQADVLERARRTGGPDANVTYVAKLHNEELHLLAGPAIKRIEDLAGKKVNIGVPGGGTAVTAPAVFELLKLKVETTSYEQPLALAKLRAGEIAALAYVTGKPAPMFATLRAAEGLHFVAVPLDPQLLASYVPTRLAPEDYPELVPAGQSVDAIAVGTVLLAANLTPDSERYRNLVQFVDAFFTQFPKLLEAPRHPKWQEVNLAADLPGWRRFPTADAWLKRNAAAPVAAPNDQQLRDIFTRFLDERSKAATGKTLSPQEKEQLFDQFRQWQTSQTR
ncbi:MAG: TRAP transporter substrate-binding protein [Alphaproteobacteria bacterium]|nr:TRAP transporter substrate-binding protein [Alphaproteobacteria bacterium]